MGATKAKVHWLAAALIGLPAERERAVRTVRDALDVTGGQARKAAAHLAYPWPGFLRLVDVLGLLEYMRTARARAALAAKQAREEARGRPRGAAGAHWLTRVHREGTDAERETAAEAIRASLRRALGDVRGAAADLGMSAVTLYAVLERYDLEWFPMAARAEAVRTKKT